MHYYEKGLTWNSPAYFTKSDIYDLFAQKEDAADLVWNALKTRLKGFVLDAGCGTGKYLQKCEEAKLSVIGVDRSASQIDVALKKGLNAQVGDLQNLTQLNMKFDSIFSCWVLGTIPEKDRTVALDEMKKCLMPHGVIYLVENKPFSDFERIRGHSSLINNSTLYDAWLTGQGFKKELELSSNFGFDSDEQATWVFKEIWGERIKEPVSCKLGHEIVIWKLANS